MTLSERLDALRSAASPGPQITAATPPGWEPGITFHPDGTRTVTSAALPDDIDQGDVLARMGVDIPVGFRARLIEVRHDPAAWTRAAQGDDAVTVAVVRRRWIIEAAPQTVDIDDLLAAIGKRRPTIPKPSSGMVFVVAVADTQLGDGDTATVVNRFGDLLSASLARFREIRKRTPLSKVAITWLGDCIQGTITAAPTAKNDLSVVEMLRVYRRLLLEQVQAFADVSPVDVIVVPGNHDQVARQGRAEAHPSDHSWAVEGALQVADALALAGRFDHVTFTLPQPGQSTITVDLAGTIVGLAHGHQWRGPASGLHKWWAGQSHGRTGIGAADLLLTGHRHHFFAEVAGDDRLGIVAPPMVPWSPQWADQRGDRTSPGLLTMLVGSGTWSGLEVLS